MPQYTAQIMSVAGKVFSVVSSNVVELKKFKQNRTVGKIMIASETTNKERKPSHRNTKIAYRMKDIKQVEEMSTTTGIIAPF